MWSDALKVMYSPGNQIGNLWNIPAADNGIIKPRFKEDILMQFTGLKDKNGVEVFENDIVEMRSEKVIYEDDGPMGGYHYDSTYTGRIVVLPSLGVCLRNPKIFNHITGEISTYYGYKTIAAYRSVKIGNIYENPELL